MNLVVMSGKVFGDVFKDYEDDGKSDGFITLSGVTDFKRSRGFTRRR